MQLSSVKRARILANQSEALLKIFLRRQEGIILLTGPTGSGKTTTLYTALRELNDVGKKYHHC